MSTHETGPADVPDDQYNVLNPTWVSDLRIILWGIWYHEPLDPAILDRLIRNLAIRQQPTEIQNALETVLPVMNASTDNFYSQYLPDIVAQWLTNIGRVWMLATLIDNPDLTKTLIDYDLRPTQIFKTLTRLHKRALRISSIRLIPQKQVLSAIHYLFHNVPASLTTDTLLATIKTPHLVRWLAQNSMLLRTLLSHVPDHDIHSVISIIANHATLTNVEGIDDMLYDLLQRVPTESILPAFRSLSTSALRPKILGSDHLVESCMVLIQRALEAITHDPATAFEMTRWIALAFQQQLPDHISSSLFWHSDPYGHYEPHHRLSSIGEFVHTLITLAPPSD